MKKIFTLLIFIIAGQLLFAENNVFTKIDNFVNNQPTPVTAYDIEAHFDKLNSVSFGSENLFHTGSNPRSPVVSALSSTHFVVVYQDANNSNEGLARVGEVSGNTITSYGAVSTYDAGTVSYISVAALSSTHFVVVYRDNTNSDNGTARVGEVSGTTITGYGAEAILFTAGGAASQHYKVAALSSTHFVVAWGVVNVATAGTARIGSVSGTTITLGAANDFSSGVVQSNINICPLGTSKFVICFPDPDNSNHGTVLVGEYSGTTITSYGTSVAFVTSSLGAGDVEAINSTDFVIVFADTGDGNKGKANVCQVSGTTITLGTNIEYASAVSGPTYISAFSSTHFVVTYMGDSKIGTVSGTNITFSAAQNFHGGTPSNPTVSALSGTHFVIAYRDGSQGGAIVGDASALLPVDLMDFKGRMLNREVELTWRTASEINNQGFAVEWSSDNQDWKEIDFVRGAGQSYEEQTYQFTHQTPQKGMNYYRLKQTDFDDSYEYSAVVSVDFSNFGNREDLVINPNPVQNGELNLNINNDDFETGEVKIINSSGQLVSRQTIESTKTKLNVQSLPKGVYWVILLADGKKTSKKITIQ